MKYVDNTIYSKAFFILSSTFILFADYNSYTVENDISLLKLAAPVTYTDYIIPACLPSHDVDVMVGLNCTISGWGYTRGQQIFIKFYFYFKELVRIQ